MEFILIGAFFLVVAIALVIFLRFTRPEVVVSQGLTGETGVEAPSFDGERPGGLSGPMTHDEAHGLSGGTPGGQEEASSSSGQSWDGPTGIVGGARSWLLESESETARQPSEVAGSKKRKLLRRLMFRS